MDGGTWAVARNGRSEKASIQSCKEKDNINMLGIFDGTVEIREVIGFIITK